MTSPYYVEDGRLGCAAAARRDHCELQASDSMTGELPGTVRCRNGGRWRLQPPPGPPGTARVEPMMTAATPLEGACKWCVP